MDPKEGQATYGEAGPTCPVCGGREFRKLFAKDGRGFWRCRGCGLQRQFPLPELEELREYYDHSYRHATYKCHLEAAEMKRATARRRLRDVLPYCRPGRWLDVGCSNGVLVEELLHHGLEAEGIDLSGVAVEEAQRKDLPVTRCTIDDHRPPYRYDTVTCFDVLEHVSDPAKFVSSLRRLLVADGTVALSVPNLGSISRLLMRRRWYFYSREHLYCFTRSTIGQLLSHGGFDIIRCGPSPKPLTLAYSLTQLQQSNPAVCAVLDVLAKPLPKRVREMTVPVYIGEMTVIAGRRK